MAARPDLPPVRTFKPRRRPLSPGRAELLGRLLPRLGVDETGPPLDRRAMFGRSAPVAIEIGIGIGDTLTAMARADPATDVIGVDVHTPGVAAALARIEELELANVRLVHGDALVFLRRVPTGSLAGIRIYFPDPWPKARHRHRRLIAPERLDRLVAAPAPGGVLHVATDIDDYATQTERLCGAHAALWGGRVERPDWRPVTRYEEKARREGRTVADLIYRRA